MANDKALPKGYYFIKGIISEKVNAYLVDWEIPPEGLVYEPTFEPKEKSLCLQSKSI